MSSALEAEPPEDTVVHHAPADPNDLRFYFEQAGRVRLPLPLPELAEPRLLDVADISENLIVDPILLVEAVTRAMEGLSPAARRKAILHFAGYSNAILRSMDVNAAAAIKTLRKGLTESGAIDEVIRVSFADSQKPTLALVGGEDASPSTTMISTQPQTLETKKDTTLNDTIAMIDVMVQGSYTRFEDITLLSEHILGVEEVDTTQPSLVIAAEALRRAINVAVDNVRRYRRTAGDGLMTPQDARLFSGLLGDESQLIPPFSLREILEQQQDTIVWQSQVDDLGTSAFEGLQRIFRTFKSR